MMLPREPEKQVRDRNDHGVELVIEEVVVRGRSGTAPTEALAARDHLSGADTGSTGYREWDRGEWVGDGQGAAFDRARPAPAETEPRWTKWEWIGEGQGQAGPRRGLPAQSMPEGETALSGNRHNPGMAHWGGSRRGRRGEYVAPVRP